LTLLGFSHFFAQLILSDHLPILFSYQNLEQSRLGSLMQVDFSTRVYLPKLAINLASAFI